MRSARGAILLAVLLTASAQQNPHNSSSLTRQGKEHGRSYGDQVVPQGGVTEVGRIPCMPSGPIPSTGSLCSQHARGQCAWRNTAIPSGIRGGGWGGGGEEGVGNSFI